MQWFNFNLQDFSVSFLSILFEGAPFMFIGTLIRDSWTHSSPADDGANPSPQYGARHWPECSLAFRTVDDPFTKPHSPIGQAERLLSQQHGRRAAMDIGAISRSGQINDPACRIMSASLMQ